jgi:hypothetical protein
MFRSVGNQFSHGYENKLSGRGALITIFSKTYPTGDAVFKTIEESIPPSPIIDTSIAKSILKNHLEKYLSEIE